ncbi:4-hydroxy-tetrahydrodipicolinate synthase [Erysipelothrix sp. HDW6C]|uniref:4-hydroxy-tetrahydrodipicolinate synthase n=1 Tax=Erysipelothrix sp. HDW6C TaxID=2714930 RepID=UPI001409859B|nr:4-hydroxy-tetrahydrodipicolinate synthase [Erysipelothrix sp. HDW6C]QIK69436.1 4-hydroxy-tetrahydrodipicolinate synthase [Erysipelothrix sp. HDW6C]
MFEGIITPIVTPFNRDNEQSINYEALEPLLEHLIAKGVDGIFVLGSNGEFHVMDEMEKIVFSKRVIEIVAKRVPVYIGTGSCSTLETIRLSKKMEAMGADALSVITPYFLTPTDEEIYQYFEDVAKSVRIPIILYNIPKATGCNISKAVVKRLAKIDNIKGIKDSSGDIQNLKDYIEATKGTDMNVLVGSDSKISEGYQLGAHGAIAGTSNVITEVIVNLNKALKDGNHDEAQRYQKDIDVLRGVLKYGTVPSIMKRAVELAGIAPVGPARLPVQETTSDVDLKIREMLSYYNL